MSSTSRLSSGSRIDCAYTVAWRSTVIEARNERVRVPPPPPRRPASPFRARSPYATPALWAGLHMVQRGGGPCNGGYDKQQRLSVSPGAEGQQRGRPDLRCGFGSRFARRLVLWWLDCWLSSGSRLGCMCAVARRSTVIATRMSGSADDLIGAAVLAANSLADSSPRWPRLPGSLRARESTACTRSLGGRRSS